MSKEFLSNLVHYRTYAKYLPTEMRRETREETIFRNAAMHIRKFPELETEIKRAYEQVYAGRVVPSMRSMQFAGEAIERRNNRMYNCFSADTKFITSAGVYAFADFNDGDMVTVLTHTGTWKNAVVSYHGKQQVNRITISRGRSQQIILATPEHTWLLESGEKTQSLQSGDYLLSSKNIFAEFEYEDAPVEEKLYWCYGYVFGDGTCVKDKHGKYKHSMVRLCDHNREYLTRFEELGFKSSSPLSCAGDPMVYTGTYLKTPPDPSKDSPALIRAFVAGYLAADGAKNGDIPFGEHSHTKTIYKSIQASDKTHIDFIRKCFPVAGVYIFREEDLSHQITNYGQRSQTIRFSITNTPNNNSNARFRVSEIVKADVIDVWCLNVEDDHSFVLPFGLTTGNCSYLHLTSFKDFADLFYMSMSGAGVGFSVRKNHISQLPAIKDGFIESPYIIEDSAEGWCDSLLKLFENTDIQFDYTRIRPMGSALSTGGTASGPKALVKMHAHIRAILRKAIGRQLTPFECHRIACMVADCVVVGGVRRGALISLFDYDDEEMLKCKAGNWWEKYPELARANNSAVVRKDDPEFAVKAERVIQACFDGGQAEPGLLLTNSDEMGVNPCAEIALQNRGVCNLTEVNAARCFSREDWMLAVEAATIIGTLQASYTDFSYVHPDWKKNADEEALLGVSITGQAENQQILTVDNLRDGAKFAVEVNRLWAKKMGIRPAKRVTTTKPSGTSSSWLGTTAGIHAGHATRYLRRVRMDKFSHLAKALTKRFPAFVVDDPFNAEDMIMQIPVEMYDTCLLRSQETAVQCLERMKRIYDHWIVPGHVEGDNTHNVSLTINYHEHEKEAIKQWMIANRDSYYGISLIPFDGGDYKYLPYSQPPHPEVFEILRKSFNMASESFNFSEIKEKKDNTNFKGEVACGAGGCSIEL